MKVAVVAHAGKTLGGGLAELRRTLAAENLSDVFWTEVPKSRRAPAEVRRALAQGAELILAWGGDGMVQRCVDVLAGTPASLAIIPAGTANLFATHLGIPKDIRRAVAVGLHGERVCLDLGRFNDERFAVMAGAGFDAAMVKGAKSFKHRAGRLAYVVSGSQNLHLKAFDARIKVDGAGWFAGDATCILVGNVGELFGGIEVFPDAHPDDGLLELGVVTAEGPFQWTRTIARTAAGKAAQSPFVRVTRARSIKVKLNRKVIYELDGGDRKKIRRFSVNVEPNAVSVCVPAPVGLDFDEREKLTR